MLRILAKLGWFGASTAFVGLVSVVTVPLLISAIGADQWGYLAVGQTSGALVAALAAMGWPTVGPAVVAKSAEGHRSLLLRSMRVRGVALLPLLALSSIFAITAHSTSWSIVLVASLAFSSLALSPGWYFVGRGSGRGLFLFEGLPRGLGALAGASAVLLWPDPLIFGYVSFSIQLIGLAVGYGVLFHQLRHDHAPAPLLGLKPQLYAVWLSATASIYQSVPLLVVSLLAPAALPVFAMGDRILRLFIAGLTPLAQFFQGWVAAGANGLIGPRSDRAVRTAVVIGGLAAAAFAAFAPGLSGLLSVGEVTVDYWIAMPFAVALWSVVLTQTLGTAVLVANNRTGGVALSATIGATVGASLLLLLAPPLAAAGAAWAIAAAELAVVLVQLYVWRRRP